MPACTLCDPSLAPVVNRSKHWSLIMNLNQNLLGKCFLVLNRHLEDVTALFAEEWMELHGEVKITKNALSNTFQPAHFNYAFLQNQDSHVHFHIMPRYDAPRVFMGQTFEDPDYPSHYAVPGRSNRITGDILQAIADATSDSLQNVQK